MMWRTALLAPCLLLLSSSTVWSQKEPRTPPARVDQFGDPLPTGVLARMGSVRLACEDSIRSAFFAPDGKSFSVCTSDKEKQLWVFDVETGRALRRLSLPEGPREHALSADGRLMAVLTFYQRSVDPQSPGVRNFAEIHVLDASTGKRLWKTDPKHELASMALSADGKLLAGGNDGKPGKANDVFLWDAASGKQLAVLEGHQTPITHLAFSADGKLLLSAGPDATPFLETKVIKGSIRVWEMPGGKLVKQLAPAGVGYVFSPNGRCMASFDQELKKPRLWDLDTDKEIATLPLGYCEYRFTPDGRSLITGGDTMLQLWDATTGREIRSFQGLVGHGTYPLAFSPDGKLLASYAHHWDNPAIRLWDVAKGIEVRPFGGHNLGIACLAFSPDGKSLLSGGVDQTARIWETTSGKELVLHDKHQAQVSAVAFSADGRTAASGDRANVTHVWDATTGKLLHRLPSELEVPKGSQPAICILRFSPDGKSLWVGSRVFAIEGGRLTGEKGELALYETASGKRLRSFKIDDSIPMAVSPDGALAVWTGRVKPKDGAARLFDRWEERVVVRRLDTGRELFQIATGGDRADEVLDQVVFSPDGRLIALHSHWHAASFTRDADIPSFRLVEVVTGKDIVNRDSDHPWTIFLPDGRVLAGAHQTKRVLAPIGGLFREDRSSIAVVDTVTEQAIGELPGHSTATNPWAVAPNGRFFASANTNHTILVWDLAQQDLKMPPRRKDATREELANLWIDLSGEDVKKAFRAASELATLPEQSVAFLVERLKPVAAPSPESIAHHIKDLDHDQFADREKARAALEKLGELAEPALRQGLKEKLSVEARRWVEELLDKLDSPVPSPERLKAVRGVAVLERVGTAEARKHLAALAAGAPAAWLTREARASLDRLAQRATDLPK
jgi:WD40 repeat protein